ncbi:MAG: arsinothricin resistance N-acetyltransferase ArsN1 family B [Pseudomonadota bacterium]
MIRPAVASDAAALAALYNPYIEKTVITFEEQPITPVEMAQRVEEVRAASLPWLVVEAGGPIAGYAYASKWKGRCAYRYSVESTVYLDAQQTGKGLGTQLYRALLDELLRQKIHAVIGGIALPNEASVKLHERLGFKKVAHFPEVGFKFGRWVDVGYWQLTR